MIKLSLVNLKGLEKQLKEKDKQLTKVLDAEIKAAVLNINNKQKSLAPVDFGVLRSSLKWSKESPLNYEIASVGAGSSYAPYVEFGTGGEVEVPKGLEDFAIRYKGKGIRKVNMRPQPFFFQPAFEEWNKFKRKLKEMLKK